MKALQSLPLIALGVSFTLIGDFYLKRSGLADLRYLMAGIAFYFLGVLPVALAFKVEAFGTVFLVWEALTVVLALFLAHLYFKEAMTTYRMLAILFSLAALYCSYK